MIALGCPTPWLSLFQALWNRTDIVRALCFKRWGKHQPLTRSISSMCEVYPNQGIITMNIHIISFSIVCIYIYILWGYIYILYYIYIYTRHIYISHKAQMQSELFRTWMVRDIDGYRWSCRAMEVSPIFDWSWIWHNEAQGVPPFCCKPVMTCTAKWPVKVGKSASCVLNGLHPRHLHEPWPKDGLCTRIGGCSEVHW